MKVYQKAKSYFFFLSGLTTGQYCRSKERWNY